jgi:hypothetical protein
MHESDPRFMSSPKDIMGRASDKDEEIEEPVPNHKCEDNEE